MCRSLLIWRTKLLSWYHHRRRHPGSWMASCLKAFHLGSGMASGSDENHNMKAFVGFVWTSRTLLMLFIRSWFLAMVCTIIMMASSTGVKAWVLFLEWLDRVEVGVTPEGPVFPMSCCEGCDDCEAHGGCDAWGSAASSSSDGSLSSSSWLWGAAVCCWICRDTIQKGELT